MRNVKKAISKYDEIIKKNPQLDITLREVEQVLSINSHWYWLAVNGMKVGFVWGYEQAKREEKKG